MAIVLHGSSQNSSRAKIRSENSPERDNGYSFKFYVRLRTDLAEYRESSRPRCCAVSLQPCASQPRAIVPRERLDFRVRNIAQLISYFTLTRRRVEASLVADGQPPRKLRSRSAALDLPRRYSASFSRQEALLAIMSLPFSRFCFFLTEVAAVSLRPPTSEPFRSRCLRGCPIKRHGRPIALSLSRTEKIWGMHFHPRT